MGNNQDAELYDAIMAHKSGDVYLAERLYRGILEVRPDHPDANHNLGVLSTATGGVMDALPLFERALSVNPTSNQYWLSYISALIKCGRLDEATHALAGAREKAVSDEGLIDLEKQLRQTIAGERPTQECLDSLLQHYEAGSFADAERLARNLIADFPGHQFGWKVLGAVLRQTGKLKEALGPLQEAISLSPADAEAHNNLGVALKGLGRLEDAESSFRNAITLKPGFAEAYFNLGNASAEQGCLVEAEISYKQAILLEPNYVSAHCNLGDTLRKMHRDAEAESSYEAAIAANPNYAPAHSSLGVILHEKKRFKDAETCFLKALQIDPEYADAHNNLGATLKEQGRLLEAQISFQQAITRKPHLPEVHHNLGSLHQVLGDIQSAKECYLQAVALDPSLAEAHHHLAKIKKFDVRDAQFLQMHELYRERALSSEQHCHICFALAKASEDLGDLVAAYAFYEEANALRRELLGHDQEAQVELFSRLKSHYSKIASISPGQKREAGDLVPIFIVGLPRSGTTLVEQIISSHSDVTAGGELPFVARLGGELATGQVAATPGALHRFREQYLSELSGRSGGKPYFTDKMPLNFRFLGLIVAAFPEAKVVHVKRDPSAVCWANYAQYFETKGLTFCYDLADILHYHQLYQDQMNYWRHELPTKIYDLSYESLTVDPEHETRELVSHLGLEWQEACLSPQDNRRTVATASNAQVRKKIYRGSSDRWKRYRPFLEGRLDRLT